MLKSRGLLVAILTLSLVFLNACSGGSENSNAEGQGTEVNPEKEDDTITIGVSYQNLQNEYIVAVQQAIQGMANELKVNLIEGDGQGKSENQINQVENFITQGVDVILLNPFDANGAAPAVEIAVAADIPIITFTTVVANDELITAHVGSNDVEAGIIEMEYIADLLDGKGKIGVMYGPLGHSAEINRTEGIKQVLSNYPDIEIVAEQTANFSRAEALNLMENWLQSVEMDAVVAQNDEMALGAVTAIEASGKLGQIKVIGIDAIPDGLEAVKNGRLDGTVFQDAKGQGELAVDVAIKVAKGEQVEKENYVPFQLVTQDNVDMFINNQK